MNVLDKSHELARTLRESQEYREFKKMSDIVLSNSTNKEMIKDFKRKQFELQTVQLSGKEPAKENIEQLQQLYNILIANPDVGRYFEYEFKFERLISDIYKILEEAMAFNQELLK
jgi:cell fate (sporulation/competence/biofilm development) regulator YlbF (YheA/YmcA/DUF963 family)